MEKLKNHKCSNAVYCLTVPLSDLKGKIKKTCTINDMYVIAGASLRNVIQHYIGTFVCVFINMSFAFGLARLLKSKVNSSKWAESIVKNRQVILVCLGTAFLLVAGIGKLGWSIQTYDGTTPAENLNEYIFLVLSHIGTFLIFVDIFLIASSNLKTK